MKKNEELNKPIIAFDVGFGWSSKLAGIQLDSRRDYRIERVTDVEMAIRKIHSIYYTGRPPLIDGDDINGFKVQKIISNKQNRYVYLVEKDGEKYVLKTHDYLFPLDKNRFEKEISILTELNHPRIPKIVSHGYIRGMFHTI